MSNGIRRAGGALVAAILFGALGRSLSGCPSAAKLEDEDRFTALRDQGPVDCNQLLPDGPKDIGCDYVGVLKTHCARSGCHVASFKASDLDLTPNDLLIARILEVRSRHIVKCGTMPCDPTDAGCDSCRTCPSGDVLLSKTDFEKSWIIRKMDAFDVNMPATVPNMGCGNAMPASPGNNPGGVDFDEPRRMCLENLFTWIADNGRPCDIPLGGSGGGGAGGALAGGAGSGGTGGT